MSIRADGMDARPLSESIGTDHGRGLNEDVAAERLRRFGGNELAPARRDPAALRLARHLAEPMSILLLAAAGTAGLLLDESVDAAAIIAIVILNAVIAFVQEGRAAQALEALKAMEVSITTVVREGRTVEIPTREVVVGDVLVLRAGSRVPADARVSEGSNLEADESSLTGESVPVVKSAEISDSSEASIADRPGMVFDGTLITKGSGRAIVVATGMGSQLGAIAGQIRQRAQRTPLQRELKSVAIRIGAATVGVALLVIVLLAARGGGDTAFLEQAFLVGVALAVAAVPEGLTAVTTVTLALGVRRMAARSGIVRRLPAVETLGCTSVLAIDKTGTVTENRMRVVRLVDAGGRATDLKVESGRLRAAVEEVASLCSDATLDPPSGDPLEIAFLEAVRPDRVGEIRRAEPRVATVPFDAERKRMTTIHKRDDRYVVATKGAPEVILDLCVAGLGEDGDHSLDRAGAASVAADLAAEGFRVVALARRELTSFDATRDDAARDAESGLVLIGLMALEDPIRKEATAAVAEARAAGVRIVMVTGDHPSTATTVARKVGLADEPLIVRTGAEIRATGVPSDPTSVAVYARVDPDQKLEIVRRLQESGHVVGVTGDGVNDAPALRRADIGVALGRSGTDVAREAGDLVITDDNLSTIVSAIREGRGIYANIRKVVDYLLACNASEVLTVLFVLVFFPQAGLPLLPLQLLWMNLVTDGLPALALGVDPPDPLVMSVPPRDRSDRLLDGAAVVRLGSRAVVLALAAVAALVFVRYALGHSWSDARAATFTVLVWTQLLHVFSARRIGGSVVTRISPLRLIASVLANRRLAAAVALGALLQTAIVLWRPAGQVFGVTPFSAHVWVVVVAASAVGALLVAALPSFSAQRRTAAAARP